MNGKFVMSNVPLEELVAVISNRVVESLLLKIQATHTGGVLDGRKLMTPKEAAKYLRVSTRTLRNYDLNKTLQPVYVSKHTKRYILEDIEQFSKKKND